MHMAHEIALKQQTQSWFIHFILDRHKRNNTHRIQSTKLTIVEAQNQLRYFKIKKYNDTLNWTDQRNSDDLATQLHYNSNWKASSATKNHGIHTSKLAKCKHTCKESDYEWLLNYITYVRKFSRTLAFCPVNKPILWTGLIGCYAITHAFPKLGNQRVRKTTKI